MNDITAFIHRMFILACVMVITVLVIIQWGNPQSDTGILVHNSYEVCMAQHAIDCENR